MLVTIEKYLRIKYILIKSIITWLSSLLIYLAFDAYVNSVK